LLARDSSLLLVLAIAKLPFGSGTTLQVFGATVTLQVM
jgi:hypothetical protein